MTKFSDEIARLLEDKDIELDPLTIIGGYDYAWGLLQEIFP